MLSDIDWQLKAGSKSPETVREAYELIAKQARVMFSATAAIVTPYDTRRGRFIPDEEVGAGLDQDCMHGYSTVDPDSDEMTRKALSDENVGVFESICELGESDIGVKQGALSTVVTRQAIGLRADREPVGVLQLIYSGQPLFSPHRERLHEFAKHLGILLKGLRLQLHLVATRRAGHRAASTAATGHYDATLREIAQGALGTLPCDAVVLYGYNPELRDFIYPPTCEGLYDPASAKQFRSLPADCWIREFLRLEKNLSIPNVAEDPSFRNRPFASREGVKSLVLVPLRFAGTAVGLMFVNYRYLHQMTEYELEDVQLFADHAAVAVRTALYIEEHKKRCDDLEELDRKKTEYLATVSHELRTPLAPLEFIMDALLDGTYGYLSVKQKEKLSQALERAHEESRLIDNLLDLVRIQSGKMQLDLHQESLVEMVRTAMEVSEYSANKNNIQLTLDLPPDDILPCIVDRDKIMQVLTNLVGNAIKFTEAGRSVTVSAKREEDHLVVTVTDTGEGIEEEDLSRIFERFRQAGRGRNRSRGVGVGLSKLSRVWVPIFDGDEVVGTIEAGCAIERKAAILTEANKRELERLGRERGPAISRTRPFVLLKLIASKAVEIVGADSASLHVYQSDGLLLMAGTGMASRDLLGAFSPYQTGADLAMRTRNSLILTSSQDEAVRIGLAKLGVRFAVAFPLSLPGDFYGVMSLYFCGDQKVSDALLELAGIFVRQMDVAIKNSLLLKDRAAMAGLAWNLSGFQSVIQSLSSNRSLPQVLEEVASTILYMLDADCVTLYQYFEAENEFDHPPIMKGSFRHPKSMHTPTNPNDIIWNLVGHGRSVFLSDVSQNPEFSGTADPAGRSRFVEREGIKSSAAIILRQGEGREIVGCLFINYRTTTHFSSHDQRVISALASSAAIAIQTARLHNRLDRTLARRSEQLAGLRAVDQAIVGSAPAPDLQRVLEVVLEQVVMITRAKSGQIMWFNRWTNTLERRAQSGFPDDAKAYAPVLGESTLNSVARDRKPMLFTSGSIDWEKEVEIGSVAPGTQTQVAVPLIDSSGLLGVLSVEHSRSGSFTSDDASLLERFAVQTVIAIHTVNLYAELQQQIKPLRALSETAARSHAIQSDLQTNLRMLLTGVTAGLGLSLSRAMLFLVNKKRKELRGEMAVGAQTRDEAESNWKKLETRTELAELLDEVKELSDRIQKGEHDCPLSIAVQRIAVPLEEASGALAVCAITGRSVVVHDQVDDPIRNVFERVSRGDRGHAIVCVPLIGRGKEKGESLGALVCDNRFLFNEREIDQQCIKGIEAFAAVAAMSIENDLLRTSIEDQQRLDNWKEAVHKVGHLIDRRFESISGAVAKIQNNLTQLQEGVGVVERTVKDLIKFGEPSPPRLTDFDLVELLESIKAQRESVRIDIECKQRPFIVCSDSDHLCDVFMELIRNAQLAMAGDSARPAAITISVGCEESDSSGKRTLVRVADTGPGIHPDKKALIFVPGYSTKKDEGHGWGLTTVQDYVRVLGGTITETGTFGEGAVFELRLPAPEQRHEESLVRPAC